MTRKKIASVTAITEAPSLKQRGGLGAPDRAQKQVVSVKADVEASLPRDQWERPLIVPPGGGKPEAYRRASTISEELEDHFGLENWKRRLTLEGLAQRPDLVQAAHTANRREKTAIIEEALDQAGANIPSRNGTTLHRLTDMLDRTGDVPAGLPANIVAMLEAYEKATAHLEVLDTERFTVQDKIKAAGTYDRRLYDSRHHLTLVADLKTGQSLEHMATKTPAQVAVYASGVWYDLDAEREAHGADRDRGLLIWLPWCDDPNEAMCELHWLDLRTGRMAILEAMRINKIRKLKASQTMPLYR